MREQGIRVYTLGANVAQNTAGTTLLHVSKTTASGISAYS